MYLSTDTINNIWYEGIECRPIYSLISFLGQVMSHREVVACCFLLELEFDICEKFTDKCTSKFIL